MSTSCLVGKRALYKHLAFARVYFRPLPLTAFCSANGDREGTGGEGCRICSCVPFVYHLPTAAASAPCCISVLLLPGPMRPAWQHQDLLLRRWASGGALCCVCCELRAAWACRRALLVCECRRMLVLSCQFCRNRVAKSVELVHVLLHGHSRVQAFCSQHQAVQQAAESEL